MKPASFFRAPALRVLLLLITSPPLHSQSVITDLRNPRNRFDYVIISPPAYLAAVQPLALRRFARNGFSVGIAVTDSISRSFGTGTSPDTAVKRFITYALNSWNVPAPRYFLLAGNVNVVPSHREPGLQTVQEDSVMVDQWYVEAGADSGLTGRFVAALGRLPAWNLAGLNAMVSKIGAYEDAPGKSWMRRSVSVADSTYAPLYRDVARLIQGDLSAGWPDTVPVQVDPSASGYLSRMQFRDIWNQGSAIVSFIGGANWYKFSPSAYFTRWDVDSLAPGSPLPFCVILSGQRFEKAETTAIAVHLLESEGKGAIATLAPSGLVYLSENSALLQVTAGFLAARPAVSIGEALVNAINGNGSGNGLWGGTTRLQTILGDPALVVRREVVTGIPPGDAPVPGGFVLLQNYPNPFNPSTTIRYGIPRQSAVTLNVFNAIGQKVATLVNVNQSAGYHEAVFDGSRLASGMYYYRIQAADFVQTKKLMLLR